MTEYFACGRVYRDDGVLSREAIFETAIFFNNKRNETRSYEWKKITHGGARIFLWRGGEVCNASITRSFDTVEVERAKRTHGLSKLTNHLLATMKSVLEILTDFEQNI